MYGIIRIIIIFLTVLLSNFVFGQKTRSDVTVGVYYFNGWTGKTNHLTEKLKNSYSSRMPLWGWVANSEETMVKEIDYASNAGIGFFSFCWYYVRSDSLIFKSHPLNRALQLFLTSPNSSRLKFNLLVANHEGAIIRPSDWGTVSTEWLKLFKVPNYLYASGKPLITFFSLKSLVDTFKSPGAVRQALQSLKTRAIMEGLPGVSVAICVNGTDDESELAKACGFDILTGYNYHYVGFNKKVQVAPIDSLLNGSLNMWDKVSKADLPYIPAVTLNWDPRPWSSLSPKNASSPRYSGFSSRSVYKAVRGAVDWLHLNPHRVIPEKVIMVYAWNEYGEGAWLAPTKKNGNKLLNALKSAIED